jgi:hypothetical protein
MRRATANIALALANGFILFFFSERLFWSVWRAGDSVADQVVTWLAYSTATYLFLSTIAYFRANTLWSVCLAGGVYGWLIEGTLVPTLYGTEDSAPFPLSLCVTGLSWHMLIAVVLGWFGFRRAFQSNRWMPTAAIAGGVGIFWGLWATFQWHETPPVVTPPAQFVLHAAVMSLLLVVTWWINLRIGIDNFRPGLLGLALNSLVLAVFYAQQVVHLGFLPLVVLPALLAIAYVPLRRHRNRQPEVFGACAEKARQASRLGFLLLLPLVAMATYTLAKPLGFEHVPVSTIVFYWITAPLGTTLFVVAVLKCWIGRSSAER